MLSQRFPAHPALVQLLQVLQGHEHAFAAESVQAPEQHHVGGLSLSRAISNFRRFYPYIC
jgi:hypothetical protein